MGHSALISGLISLKNRNSLLYKSLFLQEYNILYYLAVIICQIQRLVV